MEHTRRPNSSEQSDMSQSKHVTLLTFGEDTSLQPLPKEADVEDLGQLRQNAVAGDEQGEEPEEGRGEVRHTLQLADGSPGDGDTDGADRRRQEQDGQRSSFLHERDFLRPDHVDDQRLSQEPLHEPRRLELGLLRRRVAAVEVVHRQERADIENGAYRPHPRHERCNAPC